VEIRQIQLFIALAEESSFTRASQRMHIVQSGLSTSLKQLEEELGVRLVQRSTRGVSLTESGSQFLKHARASLLALDLAKRSVLVPQAALQRRIRFAVPTTHLLPYCRFGQVLKNFNAKFPDVSVELRTLSNDIMRSRLIAGDLDIALYAIVADEDLHGLSVAPFSDDPLVAICSNDNDPLASMKSVTLAQLSESRFVDLTRDKALRQLVDLQLAKRQLTRRIAFEVSDVRWVMDLVEKNLGTAIVPRRYASSPTDRPAIHTLEIDRDTGDTIPHLRMVLLTPDGPAERMAASLAALIEEVRLDAAAHKGFFANGGTRVIQAQRSSSQALEAQ
jgi:DNA-binding transcriptional LysR family regulator